MEQVGPSLSPKADLYTRKTRDWAQGAIVMSIKTADCFGTTSLATTKGEVP